MKKTITICLFIITSIAVNAQDKSAATAKSSPTKEQTLDYLKAVLINVRGGYTGTQDGELWEFKQSLKELTMDGCVLKFNISKITYISQEICEWCANADEKKEIDMSLVESVQSKKMGKTPLGDNLGLCFMIQNKAINVTAYCTPENSEKVLKAFNHLRKLCGAPDPISFD